jgi:hypothetical protein
MFINDQFCCSDILLLSSLRAQNISSISNFHHAPKQFKLNVCTEPGAHACHLEVCSSNPNRCKFFSDLTRALGSTQPQMGTRATWEVKRPVYVMPTPSLQITSRWLRTNMSTNVINASSGGNTYLLYCSLRKQSITLLTKADKFTIYCHRIK